MAVLQAAVWISNAALKRYRLWSRFAFETNMRYRFKEDANVVEI
jgi:hypothetical protein